MSAANEHVFSHGMQDTRETLELERAALARAAAAGSRSAWRSR